MVVRGYIGKKDYSIRFIKKLKGGFRIAVGYDNNLNPVNQIYYKFREESKVVVIAVFMTLKSDPQTLSSIFSIFTGTIIDRGKSVWFPVSYIDRFPITLYGVQISRGHDKLWDCYIYIR